MFRAMQQGKAGKTARTLEADAPVRDLFKHTEDFLTSTVFERLTYLPGPLLWEILHSAFSPRLPAYKMVEVEDVAFWPRLWLEGDPEDHDKIVEPDLLLRLKLGDPAVDHVMLIEAKTGTKQDVRQWQRELRAAKADEDSADRKIIFVALDGLSRSEADGMWEAVDASVRKDVDFVHGGWRDLGRAVAMTARPDRGVARLLDDVEEALSLYGYRVVLLSEALVSLRRLKSHDASLAALRSGFAK